MRQTVALCVVAAVISTVVTFDVGVKSTKCNLDPSKGELNDPCMSLYDGVCGGKYCTCPEGKHEDKNLKICVPGEAPKTKTGGSQAGGGGGDLFDLPFDYEPNKPAPAPGPVPAPAPAPAPQPRPPSQPRPPPQPEQPQPGRPQPGQPQPGQPQPGQYPNYPGYNPNQPGYNPNQPGHYPNQPGQYPNQPGYNPNQPGYNPNHPGQYPNQPGYNPNQPGYNPNQPGVRGPTRGSAGGNDIGEKAGGSVGGILGLLLIGGLLYFCCCRGGKHKEVMNRFQGLPFMRGGGAQAPGGAVQMQQSAYVQQDPNFGAQHTYIPPGTEVQPGQYPPQQPYPAGYTADGQQPPPYTQQYQPNAQPPQ
ncbi:calcium-binding protein P isoform X4 [Procambarus clarkii]|uniref:calcium-binding protein P isoform X4 n=1 Tax=Procambarus clarkii TaxID=6728 RepID=UPI001E6752E7|nr:DNA-directed RNA polymerase II subunit RPB1-like isoform X3 [Procambarus clarkii]